MRPHHRGAPGALLAVALLLMGRPLWCECGYIKLWHGVVLSDENSQHIADWYTFTHIIHGFGLYGIFWLIGRRWSLELRFVLALPIEVAWEILENTDFVIEPLPRGHHRPRLLRRQRRQLGSRRPRLCPGARPGRSAAGLGDAAPGGRDRGHPRLRDPGQPHLEHHHAHLPVRSDRAVAARRLIADQRSRRTALSCQRRSTRCESRLKAMKMMMPVIEIRITAANMRGMLSR